MDPEQVEKYINRLPGLLSLPYQIECDSVQVDLCQMDFQLEPLAGAPNQAMCFQHLDLAFTEDALLQPDPTQKYINHVC